MTLQLQLQVEGNFVPKNLALLVKSFLLISGQSTMFKVHVFIGCFSWGRCSGSGICRPLGFIQISINFYARNGQKIMIRRIMAFACYNRSVIWCNKPVCRILKYRNACVQLFIGHEAVPKFEHNEVSSVCRNITVHVWLSLEP